MAEQALLWLVAGLLVVLLALASTSAILINNKLKEIHILVNSKMVAALLRIDSLEKANVELLNQLQRK